ncbi:MAG TPA: PEGA domain-containing protein [Kofleriaceae bacterium]
MGRLALAGALVIAAVGHAHAGPTRKLKVDTEPEGAAVYLNDVESGVACEPTPCEFNAPLGSALIIIRKDGYEAEMTEVDVPKGKKVLQQKFTLRSAVGIIRVDNPKGALVRINKEDKGKAPVEVSLPAGAPHHVVVVSGGKTVFNDIVVVESNQERVVAPKTSNTPAASSSTDDSDVATVIEDDDGDDDGDTQSGDGTSTGISSGTKAAPRPAFLNIGLVFDVAIRTVSYVNATTDNLRRLEGGSQSLLGPAIELWPMRMLRVPFLPGFSLFTRYQRSVIAQQVTPEMDSNTLAGPVSSTWSSFEASARYRVQFSSIGIEPSVGFVRDGFAFTATSQGDFDKMPVVTYQAVRIGGRLSYSAGNVEPYLGLENRIATSLGETIAFRFENAEATGFRFAGGLNFKYGPIAGRVEAALMNYTWTKLENTSTSAMWKATGATDSLKQISMLVGYSL